MTKIQSKRGLHLFTGAAALVLTLILSACGSGGGSGGAGAGVDGGAGAGVDGGGSGGAGDGGTDDSTQTGFVGFAYVTNARNNNVSQYTIGLDGRLTPMNTATVGAGEYPYSISVAPSGRYAYVPNSNSNNISQYTIGLDGGLTPMYPATVQATGRGHSSVTIDPLGVSTYVANTESNNISQYTIGTEGHLTPMDPATVPSGEEPSSITISPSGMYAYVANASNNNISQYTIGMDGGLTPMDPATVAAGIRPLSVTVDPSGRYAYVANASSDNVSQYTIGIEGSLTPMDPATVAADIGVWSVTVDPSSRYVYVASASLDNVSQYWIGMDGRLTPMDPATVAAGESPFSATVDPSGRYAYVANFGSNTISQYTLGINPKPQYLFVHRVNDWDEIEPALAMGAIGIEFDVCRGKKFLEDTYKWYVSHNDAGICGNPSSERIDEWVGRLNLEMANNSEYRKQLVMLWVDIKELDIGAMPNLLDNLHKLPPQIRVMYDLTDYNDASRDTFIAIKDQLKLNEGISFTPTESKHCKDIYDYAKGHDFKRIIINNGHSLNINQGILSECNKSQLNIKADPYRFKAVFTWTNQDEDIIEKFMNPANSFATNGQIIGDPLGPYRSLMHNGIWGKGIRAVNKFGLRLATQEDDIYGDATDGKLIPLTPATVSTGAFPSSITTTTGPLQ